jgi:peroxiredoxin
MHRAFWHAPWFLLLMAGGLLGTAVGVLYFFGFPRPEGSQPAESFVIQPPVVTPVSPVALGLGQPGPDFALQDLQGQTVTLKSEAGHPVLINFWATWCVPCRLEMPAIERRFDEYRDSGFRVLAINFDEPADDVLKFRNELGLSFPVLLDPGGKVQALYKVRGYPTSYFIDARGEVAAVHIGLMSDAQLDGYLAQLGLAK